LIFLNKALADLCIKKEGKTKAYNTCIAPEAAYRSCSGDVHVTDSGRTAYRP